LPLPVAGAYHSPLMAGAQPKLQAELAKIKISPRGAGDFQCHGEATRHAQRTFRRGWSNRSDVVGALGKIHARLLAQGFTRFIELGPGTALSGFMKRIDKTAQMLNVADAASLEATVKAMASYRKATSIVLRWTSRRLVNLFRCSYFKLGTGITSTDFE
jgi:[acyl-carrier-protein] S-malonyltransferase